MLRKLSFRHAGRIVDMRHVTNDAITMVMVVVFSAAITDAREIDKILQLTD
jgi:hypothetical protein